MTTPIETFRQFAHLVGPVPKFALVELLFSLAGEADWALDAVSFLPASDASFKADAPDNDRSQPIVPAAGTPIKAENADIYFRRGGSWPTYDERDRMAGVTIHEGLEYVHNVEVVDRRFFPRRYGAGPTDGPTRPQPYAASVGRIPFAHYDYDPWHHGFPGTPLTTVLAQMAYHGVVYPRATLTPLTAITGVDWIEGLV